MIKVMNIGALIMDERLQSRAEINEDTVSEYAENIKAGDEFPPVLAFFDGISYYLADGYHRVHAHKRADKVSILCDIENGTIRDAILRSLNVNSKHGMRRTNADKRKSVMVMLNDEQWRKWSNSEIARQCDVSVSLVASLRAGDSPSEIKYTTKTGKVAIKAKAAGRPVKELDLKEPAKPEPEKIESEEFDPRDELIERLTQENSDLTFSLAVSIIGGSEEEQQEVREMIDGLREQVRVLNIELVAVKQSRDMFQQENSQLKQQCASYARQLKKLQP